VHTAARAHRGVPCTRRTVCTTGRRCARQGAGVHDR